MINIQKIDEYKNAIQKLEKQKQIITNKLEVEIIQPVLDTNNAELYEKLALLIGGDWAVELRTRARYV